MLPAALRIFSRTAFVLATMAVFSASCSRQPEGERCDYQWAGPTQDCNDGLVCTPCGNLQNSVVDRCCRADLTYTDSRCAPAAAPTQLYCNTHQPNQGSGGSGGTGGSAGSGTGGSAGSGTSGAGAGRAGSGGSSMSSGGEGGENASLSSSGSGG
jgi:hypothetical protein